MRVVQRTAAANNIVFTWVNSLRLGRLQSNGYKSLLMLAVMTLHILVRGHYSVEFLANGGPSIARNYDVELVVRQAAKGAIAFTTKRHDGSFGA